MFSGNFAQGFITGLADSVNKELQKDMDMFEKKKSRLGDLALEKSLTEQTRFNQERDANLKEIKMMAAQLNTDADTIQYLYNDKGSLEATKAYVGQLVKQRDSQLKGAFDPIKALRLEQRTEGKISALELANLVTPAATSYDLSKAGDLRTGFMKFFGSAEGATEDLQKSVAAEMAILGAGKTSLADIPAPISGKGLYNWQLFDYSGNPEVAASKLAVVLGNLKEEEVDASPVRRQEINEEFVAAKAQQDLMSAQILYTPGKNLTEPQIETYNSTIAGKIATKYQMAKPGSHTNINGVMRFNTASLGGQAQVIVDTANAKVMREISKAQRSGLNPIEINTAIQEILIGQNKEMIFVPGDGMDEGTFVAVDDTMFIDDTVVNDQGKPIFAPLPDPVAAPVTVQKQGNAAANQNAAAGAGNTVAANVQQQTLITIIQNASNNQNQSAVQTNLRKLARMLGPNGQPIGMAEAKRLANIP